MSRNVDDLKDTVPFAHINRMLTDVTINDRYIANEWYTKLRIQRFFNRAMHVVLVYLSVCPSLTFRYSGHIYFGLLQDRQSSLTTIPKLS